MIGKGEHVKTFVVHKEVACHYSPVLKAVSKPFSSLLSLTGLDSRGFMLGMLHCPSEFTDFRIGIQLNLRRGTDANLYFRRR